MTSTPALLALLRSFVETLGADAALVAIWGDDPAGGRVVAGWNLEPFGIPDLGRARTFLEGSEPVAFGPALAWPGVREASRDDPRMAHLVGARLRTPDDEEGGLYAGFVKGPDVSRKLLLWTTGAYAAAAGLCLDEAGGLGRLLGTARHDGLTGCLNYRGLTEALNEEVDRCEQHGRRFSCCFLDLDEFKQVNIRHGHLRGNEVLAAFGEALRKGLRRTDSVGRFGGDEFVLLLPGTDEDAATALVERLSEEITRVVAEKTGELVRVSAGIASWRPGLSHLDLLSIADEVLREAKALGGGAVLAGSALGERREA
jgi:diguanylate cyclase (GGDEF)-like protein